jgi:glycosyltransferase involved in cell wall biosynthesis
MVITFVAPSIWISNQAKSVCEGSGVNLVVINNYIPVPLKEEFLPSSNLAKSLVLGVANVDPKSFIKGGDRLDLVKLLIQENKLDIDLMYLQDYSNDSSSKEIFWNSINFLLITSRSENSPNIIFEAKGFGVPILTTDVGGIRELLNLDYDLLLDFSSAESVLGILRTLKGRQKNSYLAEQQIEWAKLKATDSLRMHSALYSSISAL